MKGLIVIALGVGLAVAQVDVNAVVDNAIREVQINNYEEAAVILVPLRKDLLVRSKGLVTPEAARASVGGISGNQAVEESLRRVASYYKASDWRNAMLELNRAQYALYQSNRANPHGAYNASLQTLGQRRSSGEVFQSDHHRAARNALQAGLYPQAEQHARDFAEAARKDPPEFRSGLHAALQLEGAALLSQGNATKAKELLIESLLQASKGEKERGVSMFLAQRLLESGERDAVAGYLQACQEAKVKDSDKIAGWRTAVLAGSMPDFGRSASLP